LDGNGGPSLTATAKASFPLLPVLFLAVCSVSVLQSYWFEIWWFCVVMVIDWKVVVVILVCC
jgi:hypothetical protein